jgi:RNA polymerase sigma factor (sigma-70 family)
VVADVPMRVRKTGAVRVRTVVIAAASPTAAGDGASRRSYESVVGAETRRLYWLALSILDDAGEAEDAVQETLLKAWRSWESVSQMDLPVAWLTRVCVNYCLNRRRLLHSRGWPPLGLAEGAEAARPGWGSDAERMDMNRAYRRLSARQRAAITLNYRYGYSVDECAVFMGCRPGTVRTHLERGLATLRKELKDA